MAAVDAYRAAIAVGRLDRWQLGVLLERARLAVLDPDGERDAVEPLTPDDGWAILEYAAELEAYEQNARRRRLAAHRPREWHDDELLARLGADPARARGMVHCPAHVDGTKSLAWMVVQGKVLLHCHAGCTWQEITEAAGG